MYNLFVYAYARTAQESTVTKKCWLCTTFLDIRTNFIINFLGNIGIFAPVIKKIMMGIPAASAMLATSVSFPTVFAGDKDEPLFRAKNGEAVMFLRCVREDDLYDGLVKIKEIGKKYGVEIEEIERDYCQPSSFDSEPYKLLKEIMNEHFPDVIVAPFLLTAGTDARRFTDVADSILRFAPIDLDKAQFGTIVKLAEALDCEPMELLNKSEEMSFNLRLIFHFLFIDFDY